MKLPLQSMYDAIASKWAYEASLHEMAAREIDDDEAEERAIHLEVARVLRQCAGDLYWPEEALKLSEPKNEITF